MRRKWSWSVSIFVALLMTAAAFGVAYGVTQTYKTLTGIGNVDFIDEVQVASVQVQSPTRLRVRLTSIAATQATVVYTVALSLDGEPTATSTVSWTAGQIPGTTKTVDFIGLSLGSVTAIGVEVTR